MAAPPPHFALQGLHQRSDQPPQLQVRSHDAPSQSARPPESQVSGSPSSSSPGLVTLLVRHLPEAIPQEMLSRLFSFYGAVSVRPCVGGRLRNCAFVDFTNEALASQAQSHLNRLRFLGKVLSVERSSNAAGSNDKLQQNEKKSLRSSSIQKDQSTKSSEISSMPIAEPIAPRLGIDYPFPPYLEYEYPPPDGNILTNIINALIAVPRFYTQVLHLMNKMNIPAPFRMALPTPPIPPAAPPPLPPPPPISEPHLAYLSNDESELESEEDSSDADRRPKRVRRETIVGPAVDQGVSHEDVGLKPVGLVPKEVPIIKKKNPVLKFKIVPKLTPKESKDVENISLTTLEPEEHMESRSKSKSYAAAEEIEKGKLPPEELLSLPMFKNYTPGNPAAVLYIKNLAKDVVVNDFYFIFGSVFGGVEETKSALGVKLMQEGRMRGQAFITFPSTELAQHALNLVNGFVFKSKPMVIQFGRNPSTAKAS